MNEFYEQTEPLPECEERYYWDKRFNFAAWLFLFMGIFAIFYSTTATSAILAITVSLGFKAINAICNIRHVYWHAKGGGDMHS